MNDIDRVKARVAEIAKAEDPYFLQNDLYIYVLRMIKHGHPNPTKLAEEALYEPVKE